jgi:hypothetical protein
LNIGLSFTATRRVIHRMKLAATALKGTSQFTPAAAPHNGETYNNPRVKTATRPALRLLPTLSFNNRGMGIARTTISPTDDATLLDRLIISNTRTEHRPLRVQKSDGGLQLKVVPSTATQVQQTVNTHTAQLSWMKRRVWKMWALKRIMDVLIRRRATGWTF